MPRPPSPSGRLRTYVLVAFLVGMLLSGMLLFRGGPVEQSVRALVGEDAHVIIRFENVGTRDTRTSLEVRKDGGERLYAEQWDLAAGAVTERPLQGRLHGAFIAHAEFEWSERGRSARGDSNAAFTSNECPWGDTIVVRFVVDTTNGISLSEGDDVSCRAR